jgi:hypothetical protein
VSDFRHWTDGRERNHDLEELRKKRVGSGLPLAPESLKDLRQRKIQEAGGRDRFGFLKLDDEWEKEDKEEARERRRIADARLEWRRDQNGWPGKPQSLATDECARCGDETENVDATYALCEECENWVGKKQKEQFKLLGGSPMKRPVWAASTAFAEGWSALEQVQAKTGDNRVAERVGNLLGLMSEANVIVVEPEQSDALPSASFGGDTLGDSLDVLAERMRSMRLPFPTTFLDADGARLKGKIEGGDENVRFSGALLIDGEILSRRSYPSGEDVVGVVGFCFYRLGESGRMSCSPTMVSFASPEINRNIPFCSDIFELGESHLRLIQASLGPLDVAVTLVDFLQSVNVDLVKDGLDGARAKRAERKGQRVPLTVKVRQAKRSAAYSGANSMANYSHRFEVAGHYTHNFETKADGTPNKTFERCANKHPEKVMTIEEMPCVRWWTPPHVKGPSDKPLVPKVRVVVEAA